MASSTVIFFFLTQSCLPHPHSRAWPWLLRVGSCSLAVGQWSSRQTCGPPIRPSVSVSCTPLSCTLGHQDLSKSTTPKHISYQRTLWSFVFLKSLVKILCTLILLHVVNNYADPKWKQCISKDMVCQIVNLCAKISLFVFHIVNVYHLKITLGLNCLANMRYLVTSSTE